MKKLLLHTPEGVRDIYNKECEKKLYLQDKIHKILKLYGYNDIQTPTFEFFDIFGKEMGSVESKDMYKLFDREGNTLVLRPDITPSVARAASKYYMDEDMPIRFCYFGNTFINNAEHQGKLKEITQIGGELIGDDKSDSDVEIIAITINSLLECGLTNFQIEIGHIDFLEGLMEEAHFNEEEVEELKILLENKNYFGVEELLTKTDISNELRQMFLKLPDLVGSIEVINEAKNTISNDKINNALDRMEKVYELLTYYGYEEYVSFDLGIVGTHEYYTGLVFKAYTYGTGDAIATGGRYDNLLKQFGKASAAMGFAINLDQLLNVINRQKIKLDIEVENCLMIYENDCKAYAVKMANNLRSSGVATTLIRKSSTKSIEDYKNYINRSETQKLIYIKSEDDTETYSAI